MKISIIYNLFFIIYDMEELKEIVCISDNEKSYIMFVFTSGVRELYDITNNEGFTTLEDIKKVGKLTARDYNGNQQSPPPIPMGFTSEVCQMCGTNVNEIEKLKKNLEEKEKEIESRERELDQELERLRKRN